MAGSSSSTLQSLDKHAFSAPVLSVLSEEGNIISTDEDILGIDSYTGLPRLPVELLPEMADDSSKRRSVTFEPTKTQGSPSLGKEEKTSSRSSPHPIAQKKPSSPRLTSKADSEPPPAKSSSPSLPQKTKGRSNPMMKGRSRSVFIRLQLPGQKTPPLSHRNLSILGESDSDTDIHTAPVLPAGEQKFFLNSEKQPRRASDFGRVSSDGKLPSPLLERALNSHVIDRSDSSPTVPRRSSFLYGMDEDFDDVGENNTTRLSRTSSMSSNHVGDETYVTPFAQILANLHRVRAQFLMLVGLPDETKTSYSRVSSSVASPPAPSPPKKLLENSHKRLALDTLEELDWCLKKLESVNSVKSMGVMAQDKFRRLMHRELSHMSENSRSGTQAAEWVQNITNLDDINNEKVDKALDTLYDQETGIANRLLPGGLDSKLSSSLRHDEWTKMLSHSKGRKDSTGSRNYCERVPLYGVSSSKMDPRKMKEFISTQVDIWEVDTFYLNTISDSNPLVCASYHVFKKRKLFAEFKIPPHKFINFITEIQNAYLPNPYHNAIHASDVFLAANFLLKAKAIEEVFTNLEVLAALIAAAIHDVGHPGKSNQFLVNVRDKLAILYNDNSVLENHHLALAFKIMQDPNCNFLENFEPSQRSAFRRMVIDMVLATDMAKHFKHLGELKTLLETKKVANDGILVLDKYSDRSEVLQCMLHCADLSNPAKPEHLATQWTDRVIEENFIQGDEEKNLGIPLSPLGDREQVSIGKCQVTFIDFIIYPLWETWAELVYPDAQDILENINKIREHWNARIDPNSPPPSDNAEDQQEFNSDEENDGHLSFDDDEEEGNAEAFKLPLFVGKSPLDSLPRSNVGASKLSARNGEKMSSTSSKAGVATLSKERGETAKENDAKKNENDLLQTSSDSLKRFMESPANERRSSYKNAKKAGLNKGIEDDDDDSIQR